MVRYAGVLVALLACGYPIVAFVTTMAGVLSTPVTIGYRFVMLLLSLLIILIPIFKNSFYFDKYFSFLLIFWFIFGCRLIWDISIFDIPRDKLHTPFYIYSYAFGNCFLPMLAVAVLPKKVDLKFIANLIYGLLIVQSILVATYLIGENGLSIKVMLQRQAIEGLKGKTNVINPITISKIGGSLFLFSSAMLLCIKQNFRVRLLHFLSIILGLYLLVGGSSRGPFIFTFICLLFILFYYFSNTDFGGKIKLLTILFTVICGLFIYFNSIGLQYKDIGVLDRIERTTKQKKTDIREKMWKNAFDQFKSNPILGNSYREEHYYFYPHNVFLESLMATGIIGSIFFFLATIVNFIYLFLFLRRKEIYKFIICVFGIFVFLGYTTSGSLYESTDLWLFLSLTFKMKHID